VRRNSIAALLLLTILLLAFSIPAKPILGASGPSNSGTIGGHAYHASGTVPLEGIWVQACDVKNNCYYSCTRADGWYRIGILPYDSYNVWAEEDVRCGSTVDYEREYWRERTNENEADPVTISATTPHREDVDFTLVHYEQRLCLPLILQMSIEIDGPCSRFDPPGSDDADPNQEWVCLTNHAPRGIDMERWYVINDDSLRYTLPSFTLAAGASVRLRSGPGNNTQTDLYWGQSASMWHNFGSTVCLYNAGDHLVDEYRFSPAAVPGLQTPTSPDGESPPVLAIQRPVADTVPLYSWYGCLAGEEHSRGGWFHPGYDYGFTTCDPIHEPILAAADGIVLESYADHEYKPGAKNGRIIIDHGDRSLADGRAARVLTQYDHIVPRVPIGERVQASTHVADFSTCERYGYTPELHLTVLVDLEGRRKHIDPMLVGLSPD
jgi:hypothetical protein